MLPVPMRGMTHGCSVVPGMLGECGRRELSYRSRSTLLIGTRRRSTRDPWTQPSWLPDVTPEYRTPYRYRVPELRDTAIK